MKKEIKKSSLLGIIPDYKSHSNYRRSYVLKQENINLTQPTLAILP